MPWIFISSVLNVPWWKTNISEMELMLPPFRLIIPKPWEQWNHIDGSLQKTQDTQLLTWGEKGFSRGFSDDVSEWSRVRPFGTLHLSRWRCCFLWSRCCCLKKRKKNKKGKSKRIIDNASDFLCLFIVACRVKTLFYGSVNLRWWGWGRERSCSGRFNEPFETTN